MADDLLAWPPAVAAANPWPLRPGERNPPYWAASEHLILVLSGRGTFLVGGERHVLHMGDLLAVPWGAVLAIDAMERLELASVHLVRQAWTATEPGFPQHGAPPDRPAPAARVCGLPARPTPGADLGALADQMRATVATFAQPGPERAARLRGLALCLATGWSAGGTQQASGIDALITWLPYHLKQAVTRSEMERRAGLGHTAFGAAFKARTGRSPTAYLIDLRLAEARRLLASTRLTVAEVAARVGIADPRHLARLYRARFAAAPGSNRRGDQPATPKTSRTASR